MIQGEKSENSVDSLNLHATSDSTLQKYEHHATLERRIRFAKTMLELNPVSLSEWGLGGKGFLKIDSDLKLTKGQERMSFIFEVLTQSEH
jgi:hypothetical protein